MMAVRHRMLEWISGSATRTAAAVLVAAFSLVACSRHSGGSQQQQQPAATSPDTTSATAPAAPDSKVKTFAIGELAAMALRDGSLEFPNDGKILGVGRSPEEVASLLSAAGLPTAQLSLSVQPLLVRTADRVLLFDTGAGSNMGPGAGRLQASLAAAGIEAGSITDIFISHSHGDHVGGLLNSDGAPAFPNAAIHISAPEWAFLTGMSAESAANVGITQYVALVAAIKPKLTAFDPGAQIIPGVVKAVEIRGHTPGHSGYLITSGQSSLLYIGDSMHHYVVSVQKPDWVVSFDADAPTASQSRKELLARSADSGQRIYAVHFPFPGIGKIEHRGEGYVWTPEF